MRDKIMMRPCYDQDVTTNALPRDVIRVFDQYKVILTGMKHGTVTVLMPEPVEVTTYRVDGSYSDSRHPDSVSFTRSLEEDLARRDFTVNAIAYHPEIGYVDPFGGLQDIKDGVIRCVGEPERRFSEDALRILRGVRFCATLGFTMDDATARAAIKMSDGLKEVSAERKYSELTRAIMGESIEEALIKYRDVFVGIIPELKSSIGFDQRSRHHDFDLYTHMAKVVSNAPPDIEVRLAALFHDIAKPACYYSDERGGHFPKHALKSAEMAEDILKRLRADNATAEAVKSLIGMHRDIPKNEIDIKFILNKLSIKGARQLISLMLADSASKKRGKGEDEGLLLIRELLERVISGDSCYSLDTLAIGGGDLLGAGYSGREIGSALREALEAVINGKVENQRAAILKYLENRN